MVPAPLRTRRDAAENRESLLAAARVELNRDPNAALESIAAAAGLSRRAVYGHFASRDELLRELLTSGAARVSAAVDEFRDEDPVLDLVLIAASLWREVESIRVMALFAVRGPHKVLTAEGLTPLRSRVLDDVRRGQAAGGIRDDLPAPLLSHLIEEGALMVLEKATTESLSAANGQRLVVRIVLALVGLGWREANELISTHSDLMRGAE